ncbi:murein biosynthesis integral membrane protein MurJ [Cellulomonas fimi]|uniref:Murein biosynthesis integral membrane protein MurJ n=1 Tax=Cellulomonas fimi TaxID=1708 RepID=A0A7Y0QHQ7_CELFI|nr:murein biosynthesis integral membrane protein MurJ [Cellulomonas fimi]NMR20418.1 murein biosynthesis integral membrane protein MurJ [Cellulomonas fimi]
MSAPPPADGTAPEDATSARGALPDDATPTDATPAGTSAAQRDAVGRHASIMAAGTAVSRVLGFVRGALLVYAIGVTGNAADAFALGNKVPNILYLLIAGGVLNAVLVPAVVRAYRRPDGHEYVNRLLTFGTALLAALAAVLTLAAPVLVELYSNFRPSVTALAVLFAYWCLPQVLFYGIYTLVGQVLNARGSFGPFMWAPVVNNVIAIAGLGAFLAVNGTYEQNGGGIDDPTAWTGAQVALLAGTATLGVVAQALVLFVPLYRMGFRYRPRWGLRGMGLRTTGRVAGWTFAGLVVGQLGVLVVTRVATAVRDAGGDAAGLAGNAVYDYAFLIFMLPHSLVTVSLLTALFTGLSARAAADDDAGVRGDLSFGLRTVGIFTVFAASVIMVLAFPLVRVLQPGASAQDVSAIVPVVVAMLVGLPAFGAWSMAQRVFYAYEDAKSMVPIQVGMALVVVAGALLSQAVLAPRYWVAGAGLSMSVSYLLGAVVALALLRRRIGGVDGARVLRLHARAVVAAGVAAAAGWAVVHAIGGLHDAGPARSLVVAAVVGVLMTGLYVGLLRLMRVSELTDLARPLLRRIRRAA